MVEELRDDPAIRGRLPGALIRIEAPRTLLSWFSRLWSDRRAVGRVAGDGDLAADVPEPLLQVATGLSFYFFEILSGSVRVERNRATNPAAKQLVDGHPGALALDVPKGHIDTGQRVVEDGSASPIRAHIG